MASRAQANKYLCQCVTWWAVLCCSVQSAVPDSFTDSVDDSNNPCPHWLVSSFTYVAPDYNKIPSLCFVWIQVDSGKVTGHPRDFNAKPYYVQSSTSCTICCLMPATASFPPPLCTILWLLSRALFNARFRLPFIFLWNVSAVLIFKNVHAANATATSQCREHTLLTDVDYGYQHNFRSFAQPWTCVLHKVLCFLDNKMTPTPEGSLSSR